MDDKFIEDMLTLTGYPEWARLQEHLAQQIYQSQGNLFENAKNWDDVVYGKGFAKALAEIINLRENLIKVKETEKANADL